MGYIIVGSEDGISIIDPHSGSWAERTTGWPRSLSTSTTPALTDNDVLAVAAGFSDAPALDPRTGGDMPCFLVGYGTGADVLSLLKDDGNVWDRSGTVNDETGIGIFDGHIYGPRYSDARLCRSDNMISTITADDWSNDDVSFIDGGPQYLGMDTGLSFGSNGKIAAADAGGLSIGLRGTTQTAADYIWAATTRTYNTGYLVGDIRGAWLANSKTVDRSYKANTLTENGSITEAAVESGAELMGYSGFSASNVLVRASDGDWDAVGTGSLSVAFWVKMSSSGGTPNLVSIANSGNSIRFTTYLSSGIVQFQVDGATATDNMAGISNIADNLWHRVDVVQVSSTERYIYVDGVLEKTSTTDTGSLSDSGNLPLAIGANADGSTDPASNGTLALVRLSATAPSATQIRQMYDAEKPMFAANAECLLQSGSTDAVLDVDVDPLTGKVLVTQTDAITIFDGLAVDSKPTVNSGNSEKGKLWGDLRAEQNSANAYVTAPAVDQRQVNEMVRGLASDLPAGVDLSKAKVLVQVTSPTTINFSLNVKSITYTSTGRYVVTPAIPFKSGAYTPVGTVRGSNFGNVLTVDNATPTGKSIQVFTLRSDTDALVDANWGLAVFGELENE